MTDNAKETRKPYEGNIAISSHMKSYAKDKKSFFHGMTVYECTRCKKLRVISVLLMREPTGGEWEQIFRRIQTQPITCKFCKKH